jgi:hypothetical protein
MLINFRQGIVQQATNANTSTPIFLTLGTTGVNINATLSSPTIIDFAYGQSDYLFQEASNIQNAWIGPFTPTTNVWLYWDINLKTGVRSFGTTNYQPTFGDAPPTSSTTNGTNYTSLQVDQHWFDTVNFLMKVWTGNAWNIVLRVFAGSVRGGVLYPERTGSQVNISSVEINAGYILYDEDDKPIKKYAPFNLGEFITTTSPLASQFSKIQNYRLETAIQTATTTTTIAQWKVVAYTSADLISPASSNNLISPAIGITAIPLTAGQIADFIVGGYINDPLGKFNTTLTFSPGQLVFVDPYGSFTTTPPPNGSVQQIGFVVDPFTIYIDIQPQIILNSTGNLLPIQIDMSTGKLHGASGTSGGGTAPVGLLNAYGFVYQQTVPTSTWLINHNAESTYVSTTILDSNGNAILPDEIHVIDINNISVTFSSIQAGTALLTIFR